MHQLTSIEEWMGGRKHDALTGMPLLVRLDLLQPIPLRSHSISLPTSSYIRFKFLADFKQQVSNQPVLHTVFHQNLSNSVSCSSSVL